MTISPPAQDPKYYFTAHSAWCPPKASGLLEVELRRPELSNPQWQDGEGSENVEISQEIKIRSENKTGEAMKKVQYKIFSPGNLEITGETDEEGKSLHEDLTPGIYEILIKREEGEMNKDRE